MSQQPPDLGNVSGTIGMEAAPSPFQRMGYALGLSPRAFRQPSRPLDWIVPVALVVAIMLVAFFLIQDLYLAKMTERMRDSIQGNTRLSEEQRSEALEKIDQGGSKGFLIASAAGGSVVMVPLGILVASAILLATVNFGLGGAAKFKDLWLVVSLSWVPKGIESIIFPIVARASSSVDVAFGPAALVTTDSLTRRILKPFDVFDVWMILIQIVGVRMLAGIASRKATTAVIALWVLWWLLAIAIAVATRGMPGAA